MRELEQLHGRDAGLRATLADRQTEGGPPQLLGVELVSPGSWSRNHPTSDRSRRPSSFPRTTRSSFVEGPPGGVAQGGTAERRESPRARSQRAVGSRCPSGNGRPASGRHDGATRGLALSSLFAHVGDGFSARSSSGRGGRTNSRFVGSHAPWIAKFCRARVRLSDPFGPPETTSASASPCPSSSQKQTGRSRIRPSLRASGSRSKGRVASPPTGRV